MLRTSTDNKVRSHETRVRSLSFNHHRTGHVRRVSTDDTAISYDNLIQINRRDLVLIRRDSKHLRQSVRDSHLMKWHCTRYRLTACSLIQQIKLFLTSLTEISLKRRAVTLRPPTTWRTQL